jgi:hypothetical protein
MFSFFFLQESHPLRAQEKKTSFNPAVGLAVEVSGPGVGKEDRGGCGLWG